MNRAKKILILLLALLSTIILPTSHADNSCEDHFEITGATQGLVDQTYLYQFTSSGTQLSPDSSVTFRLDGKKLSDAGISIQQSFHQTGHYLLSAELVNSSCNTKIELPITIYEKQILYIGEESDFLNFWFEEELNKAGYLFSAIFPKKIENPDNQDNLAFNQADILIINDKNFQSYLEKYITIKKNSTTPLRKNIILITDVNQNLLKRSLAQYAQDLENDPISIINPLHFMNLLSDLSLEKPYLEQGYTTSFTRGIEHQSPWLFISYFVDELLKSGFPIQILWVLLSLSVVALVISFLRQVVGLSVFGVYWPLFFALIAHLLGLQLALTLLVFAGITNILMALLNNRVYLLHSSKVSLSICSFLIIFILGYSGSKYLGIDIFAGKEIKMLIVFPILLMLLISTKIFPSFAIQKKSRWIWLGELLILTAISYGILEWNWISTTLLSYPELLLAILIINIIIGRFSGLQLLELIRFMPLIKKHLDQEEEE